MSFFVRIGLVTGQLFEFYFSCRIGESAGIGLSGNGRKAGEIDAPPVDPGRSARFKPLHRKTQRSKVGGQLVGSALVGGPARIVVMPQENFRMKIDTGSQDDRTGQVGAALAGYDPADLSSLHQDFPDRAFAQR